MKGERNYDVYVILGIIVLLILGVIFISADLQRSALVGADKEQESQKIKEEVLLDLDSLKQRLDEVTKLLGGE